MLLEVKGLGHFVRLRALGWGRFVLQAEQINNPMSVAGSARSKALPHRVRECA